MPNPLLFLLIKVAYILLPLSLFSLEGHSIIDALLYHLFVILIYILLVLFALQLAIMVPLHIGLNARVLAMMNIILYSVSTSFILQRLPVQLD